MAKAKHQMTYEEEAPADYTVGEDAASEDAASVEDGASEDEEVDALSGYSYFTVSRQRFAVRNRYKAGMVVGPLEERMLNRFLAESLRNNWAQKVKAAMEKEGRTLTQDDFDAYAADYEFGKHNPREAATVVDSVAAEEKKLATALVKRMLKEKKGLLPKDVGKEKFDAWVATIVANGKVRDEAERVVAARRAAESASDDLDFGDLSDLADAA